MLADPTAKAVTKPALLTVRIAGLDVDHGLTAAAVGVPDKFTELPKQTEVGPEIVGIAFTVTV